MEYLWVASVTAMLARTWIWHQCLRGIRELEGTYGNLNGRAIRSAYWTEFVLAVLLVCGLSIVPWFDKMIPSALILLQTWKAYLLYGCYRNYEIRRRQLAGLTDCV